MNSDTQPLDRQRRWRPQFRLTTLLVLTALLASLAAVAAESVRRVRDLAKRNTCAGHLSHIVIAMHNYDFEFGRFPPPYVADDQGRPLHSWRVLLLRYLDPGLYAKYDFDEPWDGPNNRRLINERPNIFGCPADRDGALRGETNYVLVTGPNAVFDAQRVTTPLTFTNSRSVTVFVVETCHSGIYWSEPRDLDLATMDVSVGKPTGKNISSMHYGGAHIKNVDHSVHFLPSDLHEPDLRSLFGRSEDGRQTVARRVFVAEQ